jgi:S1-C subfamily serine protease
MSHLVREIRSFGYGAILLTSLVGTTQAQQSLHLPSPELSIPGSAQKSSVIAPATNGSTASDVREAEALSMTFKDNVPHTRGPQDVSLFRDSAPSVVLILTNNALGSGSLLTDNVILTNFHVVDHNKEVTVVFKPANLSGKATQDEIVKADVVKVDTQRDLALVRPRSLPNRTVRPLQISSKDIEVGADVAAIGHPKGEAWTYTKGIVSAIRQDYEWSAGPGDSHHATVIQTQTPINPGNSGGPLLSEDGKIVGVNSFVAKDAEGLNFAVAAKDIDNFLKSPTSSSEALKSCNEARTVFEGRNQQNTASIRQISLQCDSTADITLVAPDNSREPFLALVDLKRRGKPEGIVFDFQRSGNRWDTSFWDSQLDDTFALKGIHPEAKLMPSSFVPRCGTRKPLLNLKCG